MPKVSAIVFDAHGSPDEVLRVESVELPPLGPDDVLVRLSFAPINPADLNTVEGKYPLKPKLPGTPGVEGAGFVAEAGSAVKSLRAGDLVILPHGLGSWREAVVCPAASLVKVPEGISPEVAATLKINPATALRMLKDFVPLNTGDWLIQNGANSAVGRHVIQIAQSLRLQTLNIVRRQEAAEELRAMGAEVVLEDDPWLERLDELTGGAPIRLALNCIGGDSGLRLCNSLAPGGTMVTYGAMSKQPLRVPNGLLIFKDIRLRGFWVSRWYQDSPASAVAAQWAELFDLASRGILQVPIAAKYPLSEVTAAVRHAQSPGRPGKILFQMS